MIDVLTLRALVAEFNATLLRGRVQAIVQPAPLALGFEIYAQHQRQYLFISADSQTARVHRVREKIRASADAPTPLLLLLRKYADSAHLTRIEQVPDERILRLEFDHAPMGISTLVVEIMGKYSNLILLDATGEIIDAAKRIGPELSRVRTIAPHRAYAPPPAQNKKSRAALSPDALARILSSAGDVPLWQVLVREIAGVSPLLAREISFRVFGDPNTVVNPARSNQILRVFDEIWQGSITPTVAYEDDEPIAVASYPLTQFPTTRVFDSMSAALETFYGAPESYAGAKEPLREAITTARDKLIRQRDALTRALDDASAAELLKTRGEMILAYASTIQPGQTELVAQVAEGQSLRIPLDPHLSPVANAQKCFSDYRKAQSAAEGLPARLEQVNLPIAYADQLLADVDLAETRADLDAVAQEIRQVGWLKDERKPHAKIRASAPREFTSRAGFTILVGRNARQNDAVTFHRAQADDWWLHARHAAGAHVVILAGGREVDDETLDYAAALAAFYSQARDDTRVEVILTQRKNVRRVKGAPPGLVTVRNEQTLLTTRQR